MNFSIDRSPCFCSYASGLIYFPNIRISKEDDDEVQVICNPSTGQYTILPPDPRLTYRSCDGFLAFDPIAKQFKVLGQRVPHILTIGTEEERWRKIQCSLSHFPLGKEICINGVLYYLALPIDENYVVIVCFDVMSEKYKILYLNSDFFQSFSTKLINYKGKLGVIDLEDGDDSGFPHKLFMWILEDVEKHTWSTYLYTLKAENNVVNVNDYISVVGATAIGEIVLAKHKAYKPFYVFYFSPERNTLRSVEIQGVRKEEEWFNNHRIYFFVDHVEDLQFDNMKTTYAATPIRRPVQSTSPSSKEDHKVRTGSHQKQDRLRFESVNKFDALCLLDDD